MDSKFNPKIVLSIYLANKLSLVVLSILFSWILLSKLNFAFPVFYHALSIDDHIQVYGPQNQYKDGIEATEPDQHFKMFSLIVDSINSNGKGLDEISYLSDRSSEKVKLLREPEIVHLQDVSKLVALMKLIGYVSLPIWMLTIVLISNKRYKRPPKGQMYRIIGGVSALVFLSLIALGPKEVFYWLHVQVFPAGHQWFFYYQESLMTTLMKAPDLFGAIAVLWWIVALLIGYLMNQYLVKVLTAFLKITFQKLSRFFKKALFE